MPLIQLARFYNYLLNVSIITRWTLFIVPIAGILWIPGILGLTEFPNAQVRASSAPRIALIVGPGMER
jgi:hypothetical protein